MYVNACDRPRPSDASNIATLNGIWPTRRTFSTKVDICKCLIMCILKAFSVSHYFLYGQSENIALTNDSDFETTLKVNLHHRKLQHSAAFIHRLDMRFVWDDVGCDRTCSDGISYGKRFSMGATEEYYSM